MPPRRPGAPPVPEPKVCVVCGRTVEWRARWARDWDQVRYCSQGCRRRGLGDVDAELERTTLALLDARARTATICPSEVARAVAGADADEQAWRDLMEPARMAARRLVAAGEVEITRRSGRGPQHSEGGDTAASDPLSPDAPVPPRPIFGQKF